MLYNKKIFCLFLLISITLSTLYISNVKADNWISGWNYRKYHVIESAIGAGINYQVRIIVHYGSGIDSGENVYLNTKCGVDFGDVRFTRVDGTTLLDYWIENKINGVSATFWVEVADDLSTVDRTIYLYYGKSGTTSTSNGDNTFIFFDDFETNLNKWTLYHGGTSALHFSGSNNLGSPLGFGTIGDFDGYSPFTLECWFRTTGTGTQPLIIRMNLPYQVPGGGNGRGYALFLYNGRVWVELRNSAYDPTNEILIGGNVRTVNDGNWHHVVATYDGSQKVSGVHIYLDAIEETFDVQRDTLNGTISCPARFNTATYGGFYWFTGDMDEVVVYTSVLTSSDVAARYNNGEGTEEIVNGDVYAHYSMDEGSGTDVIDVSGHPERNLWLATASGPVPSWIAGIVGGVVNSLDYAYSGSESIKLPIYALASHIQSPYGDKAVHIHFYDEMLPVVESAVVSIDAGEAEVSYIGLINDIGQYEYRLQDTTYNSGINRTVGWHEFITRNTANLKQFIIDGNLMPIIGTGNYSPRTFLITGNNAETPAYFDTFFITKFVNPEPMHGIWSGEDTGKILTTTILSTDFDTTCVTGDDTTQTIPIQTEWTVVLIIVDPLTTVTQTSITASVTSQTTTTSCTTSKETTKTTTTPSTSVTSTTLKQTSICTSTASTTTTSTTSKQTSLTTTTTCTSLTSKTTTVATTTTTPTTSISISKTTTSTCSTLSATSLTTTVASTTTTPTTSVLTSKTTTTTPTTSILTTKTTSTAFSTTSTLTTNKISTETAFSTTSTSTAKTTTITSETTPTTTTLKSVITSIESTTTPTTTILKSIITTTTPTTTSTTTTVKSVTTTTEVTVTYIFTRSMATVTYTSSTTSICSDVMGLVYGEFTATGTSIVSFTAVVYTATPTAWTWTVSINLFTTYTASQTANIPVFASYLIDRFTLTSATTTEIYNSYIYDAIVAATTSTPSQTINFGTITTTYNTVYFTIEANMIVYNELTETDPTTICETSTETSQTSTTTCSTFLETSNTCTTNTSVICTSTCSTSTETNEKSTSTCTTLTSEITTSSTICSTFLNTINTTSTIPSVFVQSADDLSGVLMLIALVIAIAIIIKVGRQF